MPYKLDKIRLRPNLSPTGVVTEEDVAKYKERGKLLENWWIISSATINSKENLKYPTQKPLKLLDRIVRGCSNAGDLVLDPFCGSGTTLQASEDNERRWIGIDIADNSSLLAKRLGNNDFGIQKV